MTPALSLASAHLPKSRPSVVLNIVHGDTLSDELADVRAKKADLLAKLRELHTIESDLLLIQQLTQAAI